MTIEELIMWRAKLVYSVSYFNGKSLFDWAVLWFKMSNDAFYKLYGFNFNPHQYPFLYEIARKKVYG